MIKKSYVENQKDYKYCPSDCGKIVNKISDNLENIDCVCGHSYCFKCNEENHSPSNCKMNKSWMEKHHSESENINWILINTKQCPNCHKNIEKNQGCNHMTCQKNSGGCGHEFCWICLQSWSSHQNYYNCNKLKDNTQKSEEEIKRERAKLDHDKYMHYIERYDNHDKAKKFAISSKEKLKQKIDEKTNQILLEDLQFLIKAIDIVIKCRRVLKNSYCLGYYCKSKELYEFIQEKIEQQTELLSELTEMNLDE